MSETLSAARTRLDGFAADLTRAGVDPGLGKQMDFMRALTLSPPRDGAQLYWRARVTLVRRVEDMPVFDAIFADWFGDGSRPSLPPRDPRTTTAEDGSGGRAGADAPADIIGVRKGSGRRASPHEILAGETIDAGGAPDAAGLGQLSRAVRDSLPRRAGRRRVPARRAHTLDLRRTVRHARHCGGEVTRLHWRRRPDRPRTVLMFVDVSGSLRATSADALRCAHAVLRAVPDSEIYAFGTRLTRITPALRRRDGEAAVGGLSGLVLDANGGTRIGAALEEFLSDAQRVAAARDAVVIIVSDGLERGDPAQMTAAVRRLRRLSHRLVWWSPLACDPDYRPATRAMAAILDDLDDLVGVADVAGAIDAVTRLAGSPGAPARRSPRPTGGRR